MPNGRDPISESLIALALIIFAALAALTLSVIGLTAVYGWLFP